jgi:thioredoxin reductase (NADPH)
MEEKYEVAILGGGPAGLSASIYCVRYGMKTVLISREIGGSANLAHRIDNYPGYEGSGMELMNKFYGQAKKHGTEFLNDDVIEIKKEKDRFIITASKHKLSVKAVIIALGTQRRRLNIPGEDKFLGKGVSYCATCDAAFFGKKSVAVIGGGDSACKASLLLADIASKVYMIYRGEKERCEDNYIKKLHTLENVEFFYNATPLEIGGNEVVSELVIETGGKSLPREVKLGVDGVFIEVGSLPVSDIAKMLKIKIDKNDFIVVDEGMETKVKGVFAAGDVVKSKLKQVVIAASQGAIAAKSAFDYIKSK